MITINRRQAAAGLLLAAVSTAAWAAHGHGQGRPRQGQPQPGPGAGQQGPGGQQQMQQGMRRDSLRSMDRDRIRDQDMYGSGMMSAEERDRYRRQLERADSDREWARIRAEHQREMQARAKAQGRTLDPPVYGQHMMTLEERQRFEKQMQDAANDAERERIRNEHRDFIRNRARELGMDVPPEGDNQP